MKKLFTYLTIVSIFMISSYAINKINTVDNLAIIEQVGEVINNTIVGNDTMANISTDSETFISGLIIYNYENQVILINNKDRIDSWSETPSFLSKNMPLTLNKYLIAKLYIFYAYSHVLC